MNRTDDISNLFSRFGASSASYHEFESQFDYQGTALSLEKTSAVVEPAQLTEIVAQRAAPVLLEPQVAGVPVRAAALSVVSAVAPAASPVVPAVEPHRPPIQAPLMTASDVATPLRNLLAEVVLARQAQTQALHAQAQPRAPKCKAHIVALVSPKGGVGKTTLGAGLASSLRMDGGKTLAIDLDPQNALQYHLGIEHGVTGLGSASETETLWNDRLQQGFAGAQLLPHGVLSDEEHDALQSAMGVDRHWLAWQLDRMGLGENDVVILDTPTGRSAYLEQALDVADQVIVVTTADAGSFIALDQMDRLLGATDARPASSVCSYVVNQFDADREFSRDMLEVLKRRLGGQLLGVIAQDNTLGEALAYGHDPLGSPGSSVACQGVLLLSEQLKARLLNASSAKISAP